MNKYFYSRLKVYYEDTDAGGVVYYANYLKYIERARTEALLEIGFSNLKIKEKFGAGIIVKSCKIDYKKSAVLEDSLMVSSCIKSFTKTSILMKQIITKNEELIVDAEVHLVFVNKKGKPVKIPDTIIEKFKLYMTNDTKN